MGKSEEVDRLVAEFKALDQVYWEARQVIRENSVQRARILQELSEYITQTDIGILTGMSTSNVSRIVNGVIKERRV